MNWNDLIGKKVLCFRSHRPGKFKKPQLDFILFDDGETFLQLQEQDYYSYHDCSASARHLDLRQDKEKWKKLYDCDGFLECQPGSYPF